jgi:hypothetical protein
MNNISKCMIVIGMMLCGSLRAMEERAIDSSARAKETTDVKNYLHHIINNPEVGVYKGALKVENKFGYWAVKNAKFQSFFTGTRGIGDVSQYIDRSLTRELDKAKDDSLVEARKNVAGHYKIQLMPRSKELCTKIIQEILTNKNIRTNIQEFKVISPYNVSLQDFWKDPKKYLCGNNVECNRGIPPMMVLYCARGKDKAEKVLDILYTLFGKQSGIGENPRFSEKVPGSNLIFYTQDNSDEKVEVKNIVYDNKRDPICCINNCKKLSPDVYQTLFPNPIFNESKTLYHANFVSKKEKIDYQLSIPSLKEK